MAVVLHHIAHVILKLPSIPLKDIKFVLQLHVLSAGDFVFLSFKQNLTLNTREFFDLLLTLLKGLLKCEIEILASLVVVVLKALLDLVLLLMSGFCHVQLFL